MGGRSGNHIRSHELGVRNACGENDLVIMNILLDGTIIRNKIHHKMVNQRYRNRCKMAKTYSRTDSDHNLMVAEFRIQWKKLKTKHKHL